MATVQYSNVDQVQFSNPQNQVQYNNAPSASGKKIEQPNLKAHQNPIGIFPQFMASQTESIILKEKVFSWSGDTFSINTIDGRGAFQVQGKAMSFSGRKIFADAQGNELFHIRKENMAMHSTYYGEDSKGNKVFEVKSKFSFGSSKAIISFIDTTSGKTQELLMKGDFMDSKAEISEESTGAVVAMIDRKFWSKREWFGGSQTYVLTIAQNVDMALMAAACICLDEKRNERH